MDRAKHTICKLAYEAVSPEEYETLSPEAQAGLYEQTVSIIIGAERPDGDLPESFADEVRKMWDDFQRTGEEPISPPTAKSFDESADGEVTTLQGAEALEAHREKMGEATDDSDMTESEVEMFGEAEVPGPNPAGGPDPVTNSPDPVDGDPV